VTVSDCKNRQLQELRAKVLETVREPTTIDLDDVIPATAMLSEMDRYSLLAHLVQSATQN